MNVLNEMKKHVKTLGKSWVLHSLYPSLYRRAAAGKPVDPRVVVFLEVREEALSDSFTLLWEALGATGKYDLHAVCIREGMADYGQVIRNCEQAIALIAAASWVFVNDSSYFLSSLPLRRETKVVQLWHACGAFKKFGYSTVDKQFGHGERELERFPVHKNMTCVTVSSPEVEWAYAEAFQMDIRRIAATGISRTDIFFDPAQIDGARRYARRLLPEGKQIVLYAPTFRGAVAQACSPSLPDFARLHEAMGDDWIFICRHHPFVKQRPAIPHDQRSYVFDLTEDLTIEQVLMISDICVSDYSSLVFEYSLFDRPMIFYAPDLADYSDWRGFYYPYEEMTPGPVVQDMDALTACLAEPAAWFDASRVRAFRKKFMGRCDGHATQRIMQLMMRMEEQGR